MSEEQLASREPAVCCFYLNTIQRHREHRVHEGKTSMHRCAPRQCCFSVLPFFVYCVCAAVLRYKKSQSRTTTTDTPSEKLPRSPPLAPRAPTIPAWTRDAAARRAPRDSRE